MAKRKAKTAMSEQELKEYNAQMMKFLHPDIPTRDDDEPEPEQKSGDQAQITALMQQIANLQSQVTTQQTQQPTYTPARVDIPPAKPVFDASKAPDPVDDPKGYAEFVRNGILEEQRWQNDVTTWQQRQQATQQNRLSQLWEQFADQHEDYAQDEERVEIAATRVAQRAAKAGMDVDKYMYQSSGIFMNEVVKEMDKLFGKPKAGGLDDDDDGDDGVPDSRTGGIFGGAEYGSKPTGGKSQEKLGSLSADIKAWQEKTGFKR